MFYHSKNFVCAWSMFAVMVLAGCNQQTTNNSNNENAQTNTQETNDDSANSDTSTAPEHAVSHLVPIGESGVSGIIHFRKEGDAIHIQGEITGLTPGRHGFHVHEHGDLSDKETGKSAGGHFNPTNQPHGRPSDEQRHVGDLGNIEANEEGVAAVEMTDSVIQLDGPHSIVGRALVVHAQEDDFTQPSGNAGGRVAFGLIEAADE